MLRTFLQLLLTSFCLQVGYAQVANNNIESRIRLQVDSSPHHSTTAQATVQNDCVDQHLTGKCVVYHNDQWFEFSVSQAGKYYLNISGQQCRDKLGVQVIVIEGNPCETPTYKILDCISLQNQEDVYVVMDSLRSGEMYLVNIDGFLGDYCDFEIELATTPRGFPIAYSNHDMADVKLERQDELVMVQWVMAETELSRIKEFFVHKMLNRDRPLQEVGNVQVVHNTLGVPQLRYSIVDTLHEQGSYLYEIFGIRSADNEVELLGVQQLTYSLPKPPPPPPETALSISGNLLGDQPYQLIVMDYESNEVLSKQERTGDEDIEIELKEYLDRGLTRFLILISNFSSRSTTELYFRYEEGEFIRE